jgi:hypothetical protein
MLRPELEGSERHGLALPVVAIQRPVPHAGFDAPRRDKQARTVRVNAELALEANQAQQVERVRLRAFALAGVKRLDDSGSLFVGGWLCVHGRSWEKPEARLPHG